MKAAWVFACVAALGIGAHLRDRADIWIDDTELPPLLAETSVEVRDRHDDLLRAYTVENGRWRMHVSLAGVDPGYVDMLLSYEDKRFYSHAGVDPWALSRAVWQRLRHGRVISGGSTLTMQVARLLENSGTGEVPGKLRQMRLALALERKLSKDQILELYLLHAPFGGNLEGVRAASWAYFGKEPHRLAPEEAALLVALPQSPERRRPDLRPDAAEAARNGVLDRMADKGLLEKALAKTASDRPVPLSREAFPANAPHLADRARQTAPVKKRHHLTVDGPLQVSLERLVKTHVAQQKRGLSAALMVVDHTTGEVLASVGSPGFETASGHVDMTQVMRSPGSTLKPLVYGLAYASGRAHPLSIIADAPVQYEGYAPVNFDGRFRGDITLEAALQQSLNTPVVQLTDMLGPARLLETMRQAGMTPELKGSAPGLAIALGGIGTTLEDLVRLYGGLARQGEALPLYWTTGQSENDLPARFLTEGAAWQVGESLSNIAPPVGSPRHRLAFKTGTSYGHRDAWAIGFDGRLVIGVWFGRPDGTSVPGIFGGELAAPLLFEAAQHVSGKGTPLPPEPVSLPDWHAGELPQHLAYVGLRPNGAGQEMEMTFPPDGARLAAERVTVKIARGRPPFSVFLNGAPFEARTTRRAVSLALDGKGFHRLTVIDARGKSVSATVELP